MERRQAGRFPVRITVVLDQATGRTHDVSAVGVYFETAQGFGDVDEFLPFGLVFGDPADGPSWVLQCCGEIVRTVPLAEGVGVAVRILDAQRIGESATAGQ